MTKIAVEEKNNNKNNKNKIKKEKPKTNININTNKEKKVQKDSKTENNVKKKIIKKKHKNKEKKVQKDSQTENNVRKKIIKKPKSKIDRFSKNSKEDTNKGVIYIGHLPYGFLEEGLKEFFSQYGEVTNVLVARSKKTARSKGYAWVEFKYKEVAKIAAEGVNGYIMKNKQLVCDEIHEKYRNPFNFINLKKNFKFINWSQQFKDKKNQEKSKEELKKHVENLLKKEEEKRKRFEELGISYDFPGFVINIFLKF